MFTNCCDVLQAGWQWLAHWNFGFRTFFAYCKPSIVSLQHSTDFFWRDDRGGHDLSLEITNSSDGGFNGSGKYLVILRCIVLDYLNEPACMYPLVVPTKLTNETGIPYHIRSSNPCQSVRLPRFCVWFLDSGMRMEWSTMLLLNWEAKLQYDIELWWIIAHITQVTFVLWSWIRSQRHGG